MAILMGSLRITKRLLTAGADPGSLDLNKSEVSMAQTAALFSNGYLLLCEESEHGSAAGGAHDQSV